jgi:uncharacterized protein YdbL (DUF1318 family)
MNITELQAKAKKLKVTYDETTSPEVLAILVENAELKALNQKVNNQLSAKEQQLKSNSQLPVVTIGKKEYQVTVARFMHGGRIYTAAELVEDKDLQAALLEKGSEILLSPEVIQEREAARVERVNRTTAFMQSSKAEAIA